jgi:23S rRNA pseudouridine1911/1915/1917 synthase
MDYSVTKPMKLIEALKVIYPDSSNSTLRTMLKFRRISVDEKIVVQANRLINEGQVVSVGPVRKNTSRNLDIIYEDQYIVVLNKPIKVLSVPLDTGGANNLLEMLREHFKTDQVFAVHRLDKAASGVIVFAKTRQAVDPLNEIFKQHAIVRSYVAVVQGCMKEDKGSWKSTLVERSNRDMEHKPNLPGGKMAITHYSVFHRSKNFTFLEVILETGRKHQIRVHCKDAGHPIVGDKRYGDEKCNPIFRLCLHAQSLEFNHPITGKPMKFTAPVPSSFSKLGVLPSGKHA